MYSNLVRFFYCNLEVGNLDNIESTIDTKVRGKTIVLNPIILSEITRITNARDCIFINISNQLEKYVGQKQMNEVISKNGALGATQTKEFKNEFRLFHKYIVCNIISKKGHYNQMTTMDSFIIYRVAIDEPLNLNYIILKEMADVRNHKNWALPFGALLTKIFKYFRVKFSNQINQHIDGCLSEQIIKRGISMDSFEEEKEVEEESNHHDIDIESHFGKILP